MMNTPAWRELFDGKDGARALLQRLVAAEILSRRSEPGPLSRLPIARPLKARKGKGKG